MKRTKRDSVGRYNQYPLYPLTKDSIIEIKPFTPLQKGGRPPSRINKEKPFDKAAYMKEYKVRKKLDTKNLTRNMAKVVTRKQECSLKSHPQCLKIFITNQEDTVCLRCQNYK